jgi:hypothetical protein
MRAILLVLAMPVLGLAVEPDFREYAQRVQATILPRGRIVKAPGLAATGSRPTFLVCDPADGQPSWPPRDKSRFHFVEDMTPEFAKWAAAAPWRRRVFLTQFDREGQARAFYDGHLERMPNKAQMGMKGVLLGRVVAWGDVELVDRVSSPE